MEIISNAAKTGDVLQEVGARLRAYRLQQNQSVEQLSKRAGVGTRTISRVEAGKNPSLGTVVKLLRALGRLGAMDAFLEPALVSPIELAKFHGNERQRASAPRTQSRRSSGRPSDSREASRPD